MEENGEQKNVRVRNLALASAAVIIVVGGAAAGTVIYQKKRARKSNTAFKGIDFPTPDQVLEIPDFV